MREVIQVNTSGRNFIIFRQDIISAMEDVVHQLPISEKCIAGISYINGRVLTFLDFAECIGLKSVSLKKKINILQLSEDEIAGFVVSGNIDNYSVPEKDIRDVHPFIKNEIIDKVIIKDNSPVPVINIINLYNYIKENYNPYMYNPVLESSGSYAGEAGNFYIVNSGEETFAVPSENSRDDPVKTGETIPLSILPDFIKGISLYKNSQIALIDIGLRMGLAGGMQEGLMLPADLNGTIGLAFDSLKINHSVVCDHVFQLPPLVQTKWMRYCIKSENNIFPVVEPDALLASASDGSDETELHKRYEPGSDFSRRKHNEVIAVMEFGISGEIHAVPGQEAGEIIQYGKCHKIPVCKSIITGISEYEDELLPVIDPAACYGLRSQPDESWKMILIRNGNFRCFIIAEKVYEKKDIQLKDQRELPIKLDYDLVYLCYPDIGNEKVRLVLNIEAIAVYFEENMIAEISKIFANGRQEESAGIPVQESAEEMINEPSEISEPEIMDDREVAEDHKEEADEAQAVEPVNYNMIGEESDAAYENREDGMPDTGDLPETGNILNEEPEYENTESNETADEAEEAEYAEEENENDEDVFLEEGKEDEIPVVEDSELPVTGTPDSGNTVFEKTEDEEIEIDDEIEIKEETETEIAENEQMEPEKIASEKLHEELDSIQDSESLKIEEQEAVQETFEPDTETTDEKMPQSVSAENDRETVPEIQTVIREPGMRTVNSKEKAGSYKKYKLIIGLFFILIVITVLITIYNSGKKIKTDIPINTETKKPESLSRTENETGYNSDKKIKTDTSISTEIKKPENLSRTENGPEKEKEQIKPVPEKIALPEYIYKTYTVKKGDTLYEITESFTGDGFDYPEVASENEIQNPDLIFPDQTIKIKIRKNNKSGRKNQ